MLFKSIFYKIKCTCILFISLTAFTRNSSTYALFTEQNGCITSVADESSQQPALKISKLIPCITFTSFVFNEYQKHTSSISFSSIPVASTSPSSPLSSSCSARVTFIRPPWAPNCVSLGFSLSAAANRACSLKSSIYKIIKTKNLDQKWFCFFKKRIQNLAHNTQATHVIGWRNYTARLIFEERLDRKKTIGRLRKLVN